jgi:hypothetical protein
MPNISYRYVYNLPSYAAESVSKCHLSKTIYHICLALRVAYIEAPLQFVSCSSYHDIHETNVANHAKGA